MNQFHRQSFFTSAARWWCVLLAAILLPVTAPAQPTGPQRWLLVFDLSSAMKNRLPATEEALKNFFATSASGRLQEGDLIGVWTYDQKLHLRQFPMVTWDSKLATATRSNLTVFLRAQRFSGSSRLAALQPTLGSVVASSERLTIIIFCDGESDINSTPYDSGINQNFADGRLERQKSQQPFVVLIRTLSGKSIGCTVNYPPGALNIPLFLAPPLPINSPPSPAAVAAPVKPAAVVPDLIIVGTNIGSAATEMPKSAPTTVTTPVPVAAPKIMAAPATISAPAPTTNPAATNHIPPAAATMPAIETSPIKSVVSASNIPVKSDLVVSTNAIAAANPPATNPPAVPPSTMSAAALSPALIKTNNTLAAGVSTDPDRLTWRLVFVGAGLLAVATVLVVILLVRPGRRPHGSLITSSMQDDPRRK